MSDPKKRIVLVEDHPLFRERVAELIDAEPDLEVAGECGTAAEAIETIRRIKPDLVILDLTLHGSSGLALIKELAAMGLEVRVLVLSMHGEAAYAERAIRAGARGYITKHRAGSEVVAAIRRVLAGEVYLSEQVTTALVGGMQRSRRGGRSLSRLTDREIEVLRLLAHGKTTREIAESLGLGVASIDTYRARIKEKMNLLNATELLSFAIRWMGEGA